MANQIPNQQPQVTSIIEPQNFQSLSASDKLPFFQAQLISLNSQLVQAQSNVARVQNAIEQTKTAITEVQAAIATPSA